MCGDACGAARKAKFVSTRSIAHYTYCASLHKFRSPLQGAFNRKNKKISEETAISYLVCNLKKIRNEKNKDNVTPIELENERDESYTPDNPNIDLSRTGRNYHTVHRSERYMDYINGRIATLSLKRKVRYDAVLMGAFVISSDGEFFNRLMPSLQRRFFEDATEYFAEKYGEENIISAVVHMDETTPHMHLNLVPIVDRRLCAKELFTPKTLRELQSDFWEKVGKKWDLERGKPGSQAKHKSVAEYKAQKILEDAQNKAKDIISEANDRAQTAKLQADGIVSQAEQTAAETKQQAQDYLNGVIQSVEEEKAKPTPRKKKQVEEEIRVLRTENAALRQSLNIKSKDASDLFELLQKAERRAKGKEQAFGMVSDMLAAYPDEFDALLNKSRQKKAEPYYKGNSRGNDRGGK